MHRNESGSLLLSPPSSAEASSDDLEARLTRAARPPGDGTQARFNFTLPVRPICSALAAFAVAIATLGCIVNWVIQHYNPAWKPRWRSLLLRFDLDHEPSLCAWFSTCLLLACSAMLAYLAQASRPHRQYYAAAWGGLALLFLGLSLDEAIMIHEMADNTLRELLQTSGPLEYPWVIAGFLFAASVGAAYLHFLWTLPSRTRYGIIISAMLFLGGAIGMEVAGTMASLEGGTASWGYIASMTIEELLEMLGAILFLYTLLGYAAREPNSQRPEGTEALA